jgi:mannose-6-phosphate isomerase-like protein (cupin superfamily)
MVKEHFPAHHEEPVTASGTNRLREDEMARFQSFGVDALLEQQVDRAGPYHEFLRRPAVSMGLYVLPAGGQDLQHPHGADEVYVVLRGQATLNVDGEDCPVSGGSVISVDQGVDHHFTDIAEDLHVLVVFAPPATPD